MGPLSLKGLYSVSTEVVESIGSITFYQGFHQVIASNLLLSLGVKGRVPVFCLAQKPSLIGERLSRGKAVQLLSLSRLPREASVPRGFDLIVEDAVQRSSPM